MNTVNPESTDSINDFDYTIVGGGPGGMTIAWILSKYGKKVLLIDSNKSLGGCHRVDRNSEGYFSEHGPRIYATLVLLKPLLKDLGISFADNFQKYFSVSSIFTKSVLKNIRARELLILCLHFIIFSFSDQYYKTISVKDFGKKHDFDFNTMEYLNRICSLTDGAFADRYSMFELFHLMNQNILYDSYQTKVPNDVGMIRVWEKRLNETGLVRIKKNVKVTRLEFKSRKITKLILSSEESVNTIYSNVILAIPPQNLRDLVVKSHISNAFVSSSTPDICSWADSVQYNTYIPISFHWHHPIIINGPKQWQLPTSDWQLITMILSETPNNSKGFNTALISASISNTQKKSTHTGKTADQTTSKRELKAEAFRQLREIYPVLPEPDKAIISPAVYYDNISMKWKTMDDAYIKSAGTVSIVEHKSPVYNNLYCVGTYNGHSAYHLTSIESAIANAYNLCHQLVPASKAKYKIVKPWGLVSLIKIITVVLVGIIIQQAIKF